jgi:hypothetical protein
VDYFQGVVSDYLRANRGTYVNSECCIQLNPGENPDDTGPHWFCDALAIHLPSRTAYLCEVSFAKELSALRGRLKDWRLNWAQLRVALERDCGIPLVWRVRPWAFVPAELHSKLAAYSKISKVAASDSMPPIKVTALEDVLPWKYKSWHRDHKDELWGGLPLSTSSDPSGS